MDPAKKLKKFAPPGWKDQVCLMCVELVVPTEFTCLVC